ncbi:hypothetical protein GCM10028819_29850 [Spirosoma humi]
MRKLFAFLFVLASVAANAQTDTLTKAKPPVKSTKPDKPFKVSIAGGFAAPADVPANTNADLSKAGFVYSLEPQYELTRNLEVGVRLEQAFIQRPEVLDNNISLASKAKSILSASLTANYVINTSTGLKPYVGVGAGFYYAESSQQTYQLQGSSSVVSYPLPTTTAFGGLGRIGVKYGIVHVEANYNLISDTSITNAASRLTLTANNSYFSVKAGLTIGGSR